MKSIGQKIETIDGLTDTSDLTEWENKFVKDIHQSYLARRGTSHLTEKQLEIIERIYDKHFA